MNDCVKVGEKGLIKLEEYNGKNGTVYSLMSCWQRNDGKIAENWCKVEFGGQEVNRPIKVEIGRTPDEAAKTLESLLGMLKGEAQPQREAYAARDERPLPDDDDEIPF